MFLLLSLHPLFLCKLRLIFNINLRLAHYLLLFRTFIHAFPNIFITFSFFIFLFIFLKILWLVLLWNFLDLQEFLGTLEPFYPGLALLLKYLIGSLANCEIYDALVYLTKIINYFAEMFGVVYKFFSSPAVFSFSLPNEDWEFTG